MWSAQSIDRIAQTANQDQLDFLAQAMHTELTCRDESRKARYRRQAGFTVVKSLTNYDWTHATIPPALTRHDIETCEFIKRGENLVLLGPVGTGKTHLATAIGHTACTLDIPTRYHTTSDLVLRLTEAQRTNTLDKTLASINKSQLLILDEFGYIPIDRDAARLVFKIISDAYETRSVIITTNQPFSHWGTVLTDDQMAAAMIDRIAHWSDIAKVDTGLGC
jgi:DNA replication protein DnaC